MEFFDKIVEELFQAKSITIESHPRFSSAEVMNIELPEGIPPVARIISEQINTNAPFPVSACSYGICKQFVILQYEKGKSGELLEILEKSRSAIEAVLEKPQVNLYYSFRFNNLAQALTALAEELSFEPS